jgi:hypothetical protein
MTSDFRKFLEEAYKDTVHIHTTDSHKPTKMDKPTIDVIRPFATQDDYFITFTKIPKVGINPNSEFSTPLGIYCYPLKESWKLYDVDHMDDFSKYPYPDESERNYVGLIKLKSNKGFLHNFPANYTKDDYEKDKAKLAEIYTKLLYHPDSEDEKDEEFQSPFSEFELESRSTAMIGTVTPNSTVQYATFFWNLTRMMAIEIERYRVVHKILHHGKRYRESNYNRTALFWNHLLRTIGYTGFSDYGTGLIHVNEPMQAVILTLAAVDVVDIFPNMSMVYVEDGILKDIIMKNSEIGPYINKQLTPNDKNAGFVKRVRDIVQMNLDDMMWLLDPKVKDWWVETYMLGRICIGNVSLSDINFDVLLKCTFADSVFTNCTNKKSVIFANCTLKNCEFEVVDKLNGCKIVGGKYTGRDVFTEITDCISTGTDFTQLTLYGGKHIGGTITTCRVEHNTESSFVHAQQCNFVKSIVDCPVVASSQIVECDYANDDTEFHNCELVVRNMDLYGMKNFKGKWIKGAIIFDRISHMFKTITNERIYTSHSPKDIAGIIIDAFEIAKQEGRSYAFENTSEMESIINGKLGKIS